MQTVSVRDDFHCGSRVRAEGLGRVNSNNNQGKGGVLGPIVYIFVLIFGALCRKYN